MSNGFIGSALSDQFLDFAVMREILPLIFTPSPTIILGIPVAGMCSCNPLLTSTHYISSILTINQIYQS
jgi:hypothetical protein